MWRNLISLGLAFFVRCINYLEEKSLRCPSIGRLLRFHYHRYCLLVYYFHFQWPYLLIGFVVLQLFGSSLGGGGGGGGGGQ